MIKTIFDWTKEIMTNKRKWSSFSEDEKNIFNVYMCNKILSMNPNYIHLVNYVQKINPSEKEKIYQIYCEIIPKKFIFSKYIKSSKKTSNEDVVKKVAQYYDCSLGEAEEYIPLLRKEGVTEILNKLGVEEKEQKKLLKEIK